MSNDTFFVSSSLTGRLTESNLENQSEEFKDYEYISDTSTGPSLECVLIFNEASSIVATITNAIIDKTIDELTINVPDEIDLISKLILNKTPVDTVEFYDSDSLPMASFDLSKKSYKSLIIWSNENQNYQVRLIFI
jgi:hypothetical protein